MARRLLCVSMLGAMSVMSHAANTPDDDVRAVRDRLAGRLVEGFGVRAERVREALGAQREDGSWPDIDYEDDARTRWEPLEHLDRLAWLAQAYAAPESPLAGDGKLLDALRRGLTCWAGRDPRSTNWWQNRIGAPTRMAHVLLLIGDKLPAETFAAAMATVRRAQHCRHRTGQNLVWISRVFVAQGCLEGRAEPVRQGARNILGQLRVTGGEGIQADFSFHQHGPQLYSGGYGWAFVFDCVDFAAVTRGTRFAPSEDQLRTFASLLLDGHRWMIYDGVMDYHSRGREITRGRSSDRSRRLAGAVRQLLRLDVPRRDELEAMLRRLRGSDGADPLTGSRHFWRSDFHVHRRAGWYASVKMASKRTVATESGNGEGMKNWYMGSGTNFLLRRGDEYQGIFPVWDWRRLPGTTVAQSDEPLPQATWGGGARGETSFAGGVSDGRFGLAAGMYAKDGVTGRKAWFFLDEGYVCLGADIEAQSDAPVYTTVNQCRLGGEVRVDGDVIDAPDGVELKAPRRVRHDGVAYVFLDRCSVGLRAGEQTGSRHRINRNYSRETVRLDVFTLWIDHGRRPEGQSYAYLVLPGVDAAGGDAERRDPPVRVEANTAALQAVTQPKLGLTGAAFYEPGALRVDRDLTVRVDRPCLLLLGRGEKTWSLAASNPENRELTVRVDLSHKLSGEQARWLGEEGVTRVRFDLPGGLEAGRSAVRTLRP